MTNAVWTVWRKTNSSDPYLQGVFSARWKMTQAVERDYDNVVWVMDEKGKPFRADAKHPWFGEVVLWFKRMRLDELKA